MNDMCVDNIEWSDEDEEPTIIDNAVDYLLKFNTYFFLENEDLQINRKLGTINYIKNNKTYIALHSKIYPKIIYNGVVYNDLYNWITYIKK